MVSAVRCVLATLSALVLSAGSASAATRYVFTTFTGDAADKQRLSVYTSTDGLNFKALGNETYAGPTGVLRDPTIMKHSDGKYYIAYTLQSWTTNSTSFALASSTDLRKWTFVKEVPSGVPNTRMTWAPEWFKDGDSIHLLVNIDTTNPQNAFRTYAFKAKDDTLLTWDAPVPIGIGPNYIDTFVVKQGATYHAFTKDESTKFIEHATASALTGPWEFTGKRDWAGWGEGKEGIALFQLDNGDWRMFLDCYGNCGFLYSTSTDLMQWSRTNTVPGGLSGTVRHGTVLREEIGGGAGGAGGSSSGGAGGTSSGGASSGGSSSSSGGTSLGAGGSGGTSLGAGGAAATSGGYSATLGGASGSANNGSGGAAPSNGGSAAGGVAQTNGGASGGTPATAGGATAVAMKRDEDGGCNFGRSRASNAAYVGLALVLGLSLRRGRRRNSAAGEE